MSGLTILIPFYNEQETLDKSVKRVIKYVDFDEIILIDDNSSDNSPEIAKNICSQNKNMIYINTEKNLGKGGALNFAKPHITSTFIGIHDADLEYDPKDLQYLFNKMMSTQNSDFGLGSRFLGKLERKNNYIRTYLANKFLSKLFSVLFNLKITDVATCYKIFPNDFFQNTNFNENGFTIEVEILSKYLKKYPGSLITEVPISYSGRTYQEGKKIKFIDGIRYLTAICKFRFKN